MKKIKYILLAAIISVTVSSCIVDDEADDKFAKTPPVVGFEERLAAESYFEDQGAVLKNYPIKLIGLGGDGTGTTEDIIVNYEIDTEASTATEGQEYNLVDNSGSLTIPAGSTYVNIPVEINTGDLDPNTPTRLVIELTGTNSDYSVVSSLNNILEITFVGCQSDVDQYTYDVTTTRVSNGNLVASTTETISEIGTNQFRTMSTGPYGPSSGNYAGSPLSPPANYDGFNFIDICGEITINNQSLGGFYTNEVYGSGEIDPETGTITLTYTITFGDGNQTFNSVFVRQ